MTSEKRQQREEENVPLCRKPTDFTIEHILNRAGNSRNPSPSSSLQRVTVNSPFYNYFPLPPIPQSNLPRLSSPLVPDIENYAATSRSIHSFTNDKCYQEAQELNDNFETQNSGLPFTWLQCTRYCPPKIPRKKEGPQKRQLGRHPRIPFTSHQLSILEDKFKQSPYLSSEEVTKISRILDLADIRVKIWFQNRRARERRERLGINNLSPSHNSPPSSPSKDHL